MDPFKGNTARESNYVHIRSQKIFPVNRKWPDIRCQNSVKTCHFKKYLQREVRERYSELSLKPGYFNFQKM